MAHATGVFISTLTASLRLKDSLNKMSGRTGSNATGDMGEEGSTSPLTDDGFSFTRVMCGVVALGDGTVSAIEAAFLEGSAKGDVGLKVGGHD